MLRLLPLTMPALVLMASLSIAVRQADGADAEASEQFLNFVRAQAARLRAKDRTPGTMYEWRKRRAEIRRGLEEAWGKPFLSEPAPLNASKVGELQRDDYRLEKIVFETRPDIWMTANAYVPDKPGRLPAVLVVHGHWRGAKQDPVVQARCIGLAKHGFFVLAVDAFGAGERGIGKALGEYHGEMVAATLLPVGLPLCGLQVYENMRAVDYLRSRSEVDPERIGITGASGGGNQTMYAAAWDERLKAAVPVCSVGNYQAYLGVACCMCEVVPGALKFTEEWGVLSQTAPRALMIINATRDSIQFSVEEARKSVAMTLPVFQLFNKANHLNHSTFESPHDYNKAMREAMYGWMTLHLKNEGDGSPLPEPELKTEDPESIRCYPGESRPYGFVTIPEFASVEGSKALEQRRRLNALKPWDAQAKTLRKTLADKVLGGFPEPYPVALIRPAVDTSGDIAIYKPEQGVMLPAHLEIKEPTNPLAVLLSLDGMNKSLESELPAQLRRSGWDIAVPELRATGQHAPARDAIRRAPDHNSAEWALWMGRPLLGQWVVDVRRLLDAIHEQEGRLPKKIAVIGTGPAGVVALCAAALDTRITHVATIGSLASYVTDEPFENQRLGIMAPGILREVGDIAELAALVAPRRVVIAGGVSGGGKNLSASELTKQYATAARIFNGQRAAREFVLLGSMDVGRVVESLN